MNASIEECRGAEEQFARTFEEYLKEGYAPTNALQSLFRRFSSWLKSIYGFLAAVPDSKMDDGVRQLFDLLSAEVPAAEVVQNGICRGNCIQNA